MNHFSNHPSRLINFLARLGLFAFATLILFARVVSASISHDEYQFVASSQVLVSQGLLPYRDYPFLHMPYLIPINALGILLSDYHLFAVRSINALFFLACLLVLFSLVVRLFRSQSAAYRNFAGALAVLYFLFDPTLRTMDGRALNHALPTLLSLAAFVFLQNAVKARRGHLFLFAAGALVGLAAGVRLSFAVLAFPIIMWLLIEPWQLVYPRLKRAAAFVAGLAISWLPVTALFLMAPENFYFGNYLYIRLNTLYREGVNFQSSMSPLAKAQYFAETVLSQPTSLLMYTALLFTVLYLAIQIMAHRNRQVFPVYLPLAMSIVLLAASFAPTPLWPQYFFAPMPFIILGVFHGVNQLQNATACRFILVAMAIGLVVSFPFQPVQQQFNTLLDPSRWVPVQAHQFANRLQEVLLTGKVATLSPIFPLEAGLDTYPSFIVGPFVWRTAPLLSAHGRQTFGITSFHELDALLDADPPVAILVGFETDYGFDAYSFGKLEQPLIDYALRRNYQPSLTLKPPFWPGEITLWTRPEGP